MSSNLARRTITTFVALAITVAATSVALGAGSTLTLKLKGEYAKRTASACHKHEHFRLYHRRSVIAYKGFLTPHPAGHFPVTLDVQRCSAGRFRTFANYQARGKKLTGKYKGSIAASGLAPRSHARRAISYFWARAVASGARSRKAYFAITN